MSKDIITTTEAARIYKEITGECRSPKCVEADVRAFHHLGCFDCSCPGPDPKLKGVNRHAWEYFVKMRLLTRGRRQIFSGPDEDQ